MSYLTGFITNISSGRRYICTIDNIITHVFLFYFNRTVISKNAMRVVNVFLFSRLGISKRVVFIFLSCLVISKCVVFIFLSCLVISKCVLKSI